MIRYSVLYPIQEDSTFDWDYYVNVHVPLVKRRLGKALLGLEIDRGIGSREPNAPAPFKVVGHLKLNSLEDFRKAREPHGQELRADVANYTNIKPLVQISEIAVGG